MKTFTKISTLFFFAIAMIFAVPAANASSKYDPTRIVEMRFLKGDHVAVGNTITAELSANTDTEITVLIENADGNCYGEKQIIVDNGSKLVKFKVTDIPAGLYYITLNYAGRTQKHAFVVEKIAS